MAESERHMSKTIAQMNGPWAVGFKLMLLTYPILFGALIGWGTWVTKELIITSEFRNRGDRFTTADAERMRREIDGQFAALPPKDWRDKYASMERQLMDNNVLLIQLKTTLNFLADDIKQIKKVNVP